MSHPKKKNSPPPLPWERQPKESEEAYEAFLAYRDLGVDRSLDRASQVRTKSIQTLKTFSARWDWIERCRHWDNYLQSERDKIAARYQAALERRRLAVIRESLDIAGNLRRKARDMLAWPMAEERSEDGLTLIKPARWAFSTALDMIRLSTELEAAALKATEEEIDGLSDAEHRAIMEASHLGMLEVISAVGEGSREGEPE
jgi:hypothetical protein